jgi:6-phosphogluconolactonase
MALSLTAQGADMTVFAGTYTGNGAWGIYSTRFDSRNGSLSPAQIAIEERTNPSFLAISGKYLYAANENEDGSVTAFSIDGGTLTRLNKVRSEGSGPCHVAVDKTGKWLFVANYQSGSIASFQIHEDGTLAESVSKIQQSGSSADRERQSGPHAHQVALSPDNKYLLVPDLGADQVFVYRFDAQTGTLARAASAALPPGSGPRHLAWSPDGKYVYLVAELTAMIYEFRWNAPNLTPIASVSMLPAGYTGPKSGAEIMVHPDGKFLYASNRGHDSIAIFRIAAEGKLESAGEVPSGGKTPRNFTIDPSGKYLLAANQDSGTVVVFRIDPATGALTQTPNHRDIPFPVSLVFSEQYK